MALNEDDVVTGLVADPREVPDARMFIGLLGRGLETDYWRLYFSTELKDYIEVREEDILLTRSLKTPENPLGGTAVWIRSGADVRVTRRASDAPELKFLTGQITARFLRGAMPTGLSHAGSRFEVGGLKSVPPVESCVPALCLPVPTPPEPGETAVCTLSTSCMTEFLCL